MKRQISPSNRLRRCALALAAALFLVAYLCDVQHQASVVHATCPVDGEVAHVGPDHAHGHAAFAAGEGRVVAAQGSAGDVHEHCSRLLLSKKRGAPAGPALQVRASLQARAGPGARGAEPRSPRFARPLLAPKNSPPVGAAA